MAAPPDRVARADSLPSDINPRLTMRQEVAVRRQFAADQAALGRSAKALRNITVADYIKAADAADF